MIGARLFRFDKRQTVLCGVCESIPFASLLDAPHFPLQETQFRCPVRPGLTRCDSTRVRPTVSGAKVVPQLKFNLQ